MYLNGSFCTYTPLTALRKLCFVIYMCRLWCMTSSILRRSASPKIAFRGETMKKESSQRVTEDRFFSQTTQTCSQCVYREASFVSGTGMHPICTKLQIKLFNIKFLHRTQLNTSRLFKCILVQVVTDLMSPTVSGFLPLYMVKDPFKIPATHLYLLGNHTIALQL